MAVQSEVVAAKPLVDGSQTTLHSHPTGGESEAVVVKVGDTSNATTTFANATGLSFTALANKTYIIEGWIRHATSATTVGIKLSISGPVTPAFVSVMFFSLLSTGIPSGGGGNAYDIGTATASSLATTDNLAKLYCLFRNGATQGAVIVRFAAETTGTVTIKDGSVLRYRQVD